MKHWTQLTALLGGALSAAAASAPAATITSYDLTANTGDEATEPAASSATGVTGLPISRGAGITPSAAANSFSATGFEGTASSPAADTEYMSLGFSVNPGFEVDLNTLTIAVRSSNTGPGTLGLYYNGDSFASPLFTFVQSGTAFNNQVVNLSSLDDLTGPVEFRLIEIGNTQADGVGDTALTGAFRIAEYTANTAAPFTFVDVTFDGSVTAVPEPAAFGLLGAAGLLALRRRRR